MKNILLVILLFCSVHWGYGYVEICPNDDSGNWRNGCLRISRVKIDGVWVEANCENVTPPEGWYIYNDC